MSWSKPPRVRFRRRVEWADPIHIGARQLTMQLWKESRGTQWLVIKIWFQIRMSPPKVRMRTPSPTFYAFLVKFAERLASKPGNDQSKTHSCTTCPLQKLVDPPVDPKDEITSGTTGIEAKMDPTIRLVTHHSRCCRFGWEKETWRRQTTGDYWIFSCFWWEMAPSSPPSNSE
mgnify:CR=1 FL=1